MLLQLFTLVAVPALAAGGPPDTPPQRTDFSRLTITGIADCDAWVKAAPHNLLSYACFHRATLRPEWRDEAVRHLETLAARQPPEPRAQLYLGLSRIRLGARFDAETPLRAAAQGLADQGEAVGEVYARLFLDFVLRRKGRGQEGHAGRALRHRPLALGHALGPVAGGTSGGTEDPAAGAG